MTKTPQEINNYLNEYIIGQERAKKVLSVAVYNHQKRIDNPNLKLRKSNVMLVGPSGSGKTLLVQTIARLLGNVPFYCADATSLTAAGYVGSDVESILAGLLKAADGCTTEAARGVVFIDEFDKLKKSNMSQAGTTGQKDVGGESVQQGLLKMLEGATVPITEDGDGRPQKRRIVLKTDNILFILGGAFVGLADKNDNVTSGDLIDFGILPEVMGRVPMLSQLRDLTREEMRKVLTEVKGGPVEEYTKLFSSEDVALVFSDAALDAVVEKAILKRTGTRSLRSIIEDALIDTMFEVPSMNGDVYKIVVTPEAINKIQAPRMYKSEKSKRQQRRERAKDKVPA